MALHHITAKHPSLTNTQATESACSFVRSLLICAPVTLDSRPGTDQTTLAAFALMGAIAHNAGGAREKIPALLKSLRDACASTPDAMNISFDKVWSEFRKVIAAHISAHPGSMAHRTAQQLLGLDFVEQLLFAHMVRCAANPELSKALTMKNDTTRAEIDQLLFRLARQSQHQSQHQSQCAVDQKNPLEGFKRTKINHSHESTPHPHGAIMRHEDRLRLRPTH